MHPDLANFFEYRFIVESFPVMIIEISQEATMTSRASNWPDPVPYSELSERQQEILEFLWNCPSPYSPSFREIGNAVGLTGPNAVRYQIVELERKGWVQRHPGFAATGSPTSARPGTASRAPGRWP